MFIPKIFQIFFREKMLWTNILVKKRIRSFETLLENTYLSRKGGEGFRIIRTLEAFFQFLFTRIHLFSNLKFTMLVLTRHGNMTHSSSIFQSLIHAFNF